MLSATERTIEKVMETAIRSTADARAPKKVDVTEIEIVERNVQKSKYICVWVCVKREEEEGKKAKEYKLEDDKD